ncbi:polyketide cyclase [Streptomyces solincola]|uniref:Polyketide cyclase n=1 Tax=Streptomyces solincola TaxID=2100817 RepID=A0A2S9PS50_9ACTN|nr:MULTISPECIES: SRPBCC family protein [Streptomyces]PRH77250.1 polyketide cyclase [Streptomyces solincola]
MDRHHYRFAALWRLPAPPDTVYAALARVEDYPLWWPQVRRVVRLDARTGAADIRSALPYTLRITLTERRRDPAARVLESALGGDMDGHARWTVVTDGAGGSLARYEQEVTARRPLLRRLALPARPLLRANHAWMMRAGRHGLAARLEAV